MLLSDCKDSWLGAKPVLIYFSVALIPGTLILLLLVKPTLKLAYSRAYVEKGILLVSHFMSSLRSFLPLF